MKEQKKSLRVGTAAAALSILGLLVLRGVLGMWNPDGGNGGEPKFYLGPVLPLTAISGGESLEVERQITLGFSAYGESEDSESAQITDTYSLTNPTNQAITVELAYPYLGSLADPGPTVSMAAGDPETTSIASVDPAQAIEKAENWEEFRDAVNANDYLSEALAEPEASQEPVVVYVVKNIRYEGDEELNWPNLGLSYDTPAQGVEVWTYRLGFTRSLEDEGREEIGFSFPDQDWGVLVVRGGDLKNLRFQGYNDSKFPPDVTLEGVEYELERLESTFGEVLAGLAQCYDPELTEELYSAVLTRIHDERYHTAEKVQRNILEMFRAAASSQRLILYKTFTLTVGPGCTVELRVDFTQEPSTELSGFEEGGDTYDMATRLGSSLNFTALSASVQNTDHITILDQNFGFDLEADITTVDLSLDTERYYIRVARKE